MENTAFNGDDESSKHPHRVEEKENGKAPQEIGINIDSHLKETKPRALAPYAGMNKEDLLRFSDTPFWNRLRLACLILFWLIWIGLLAAIVTLTIVLPRCQDPPSQTWWQKSVFYQVYVRSFQDSNGDGSGDLKGLESRLDYLESLSVDAIVMSSVLDSAALSNTDVDVGYQVVNYTNIDGLFGDLNDMDDLITAAHDRGMKVVMDFVPNYSSDQHPWFLASSQATSPSDPYSSYYVWRDCGVNGTSPPTNWRSVYDQSAWNYHPVRGQCYLAQFLPGQPDLNLESENVQLELEAVLRFWLDRGVDGFRVNSIAFLYENTEDLEPEAFNNETCTSPTDEDLYDCYSHENTRDREEIHYIVESWKQLINEYSLQGQPRVLITDADSDLTETGLYFRGPIGSDLPLYYELRDYSGRSGREIVQDIIQPWISEATSKGGTTDWLVDYQDVSRVANASDISVPLSVLSLTLPGAPFIYYGQELGLTDGLDGSPPVDPAGTYGHSRDPYRSPMPWSSATHGGFTNGTNPYLPVNNDYTTKNVKVLEGQSDSILNLFKRLMSLKRDNTAFQYGDTHFNTGDTPEQVAAFIREYDGTDRYLVIVNLSDQAVTSNYELTYGDDFDAAGDAVIAFRTHNSSGSVGDEVSTDSVRLEAYGAVILSWEYSR